MGGRARGKVSDAPEAHAHAAREPRLRHLLAEDFATYEGGLLTPGLWAVIAHRLGEGATSRPKGVARGILEGSHRVLATAVDLVWGIKLPREVILGRRVRLWHNGCMLLDAKAIGDDVHIRHATTFGVARGRAKTREELPVIEDGADLGSGVCVLGPVHVGRGAVVGANSVVLKDVPPGTTVMGVPARVIPT